jgi:hypothetical protein
VRAGDSLHVHHRSCGRGKIYDLEITFQPWVCTDSERDYASGGPVDADNTVVLPDLDVHIRAAQAEGSTAGSLGN